MEICFSEPEIWGLIAKALFVSLNMGHCSLKPARKTHWFIFLFSIASDLVKYLSFLKDKGCLLLLAWKSSDSTILPNQGNNRYDCQYSQNTLPLTSFLMEWYSVS